MKINEMFLTLLMISCFAVGMANRVYVHPFNLFSFENISCEVIQKEDHQPLETVHSLTPLQGSTTESDPRPSSTTEDLKNLTQRTAVLAELQNSLGLRMYQALSRTQKHTNTLLSPINAFGTLVTLFLGASKKTAISYQQLLGLNRESDRPDCEYFMDGHTVLRTLQAISSHVDESQNKFKTLVWTFINNDADLSKDFVRGTQDFSDQSFVRAVDFSEPKEAEVQVNDFIQKTTDSKEKMFTDMTPKTNLLFASSVNFKGNWKFASRSNAIPEQDFCIDEKSSVKVPLTKYEGVYMYFSDSDRKCFIVKISLSKRTYILLVLPYEETSLQDIEKQLRTDIISKWNQQLKENHLVLYLPKFSLTAVTDLRSVLSEMAVEKYLMGSDASFSRLSSKENFTVDQVFNKNVLEVAEDGAKVFQRDDKVNLVQSLTFNRPFFFTVVEGNSNAILMLGKIVNPAT